MTTTVAEERSTEAVPLITPVIGLINNPVGSPVAVKDSLPLRPASRSRNLAAVSRLKGWPLTTVCAGTVPTRAGASFRSFTLTVTVLLPLSALVTLSVAMTSTL